jgi:hypothetical protein
MFFLEDLKVLRTTKLRQKLQDLISKSFPGCMLKLYASTPDDARAMRSAVVELVMAYTCALGKEGYF